MRPAMSFDIPESVFATSDSCFYNFFLRSDWFTFSPGRASSAAPSATLHCARNPCLTLQFSVYSFAVIYRLPCERIRNTPARKCQSGVGIFIKTNWMSDRLLDLSRIYARKMRSRMLEGKDKGQWERKSLQEILHNIFFGYNVKKIYIWKKTRWNVTNSLVKSGFATFRTSAFHWSSFLTGVFFLDGSGPVNMPPGLYVEKGFTGLAASWARIQTMPWFATIHQGSPCPGGTRAIFFPQCKVRAVDAAVCRVSFLEAMQAALSTVHFTLRVFFVQFPKAWKLFLKVLS